MYQLRFFIRAILLNFKLSLALRGVFFLTIFIAVVKQMLFLVGWNFFFQKYKVVQGWNFDNMLLMYGIVAFGVGVVESFFYGLKELPRIIESGQLDTFILQPKSMILNIALSRGDFSAMGEIVTGIILIIYSGFLKTAFFPILLILILSICFLFALLLYLSCIAFFVKDARDFIRELNLNAIIMATQPTSAYQGLLKMLTFTIIPVAFISFFPIEYIRTGTTLYLGWSILGTGLFLAIACWLFHLGVKRYESGNLIVYRT